jgi:hypothetical protein
MPEKQQTYTYAVHKLDEDGKRCGFVHDAPKLISAVDEGDAKMRIAGRLAKDGSYDPDKPTVEIEVHPFAPAPQQQQRK